MKKYFEELSDSRQQWKIKYNLVEVVVMAIIAVTAATTGSYWNSIYDDFKLYSRFCEGYTGEGVTLRSGEVIVPKGDPSQIAQIAETSPETTDENVAAQ